MTSRCRKICETAEKILSTAPTRIQRLIKRSAATTTNTACKRKCQGKIRGSAKSKGKTKSKFVEISHQNHRELETKPLRVVVENFDINKTLNMYDTISLDDVANLNCLNGNNEKIAMKTIIDGPSNTTPNLIFPTLSFDPSKITNLDDIELIEQSAAVKPEIVVVDHEEEVSTNTTIRFCPLPDDTLSSSKKSRQMPQKCPLYLPRGNAVIALQGDNFPPKVVVTHIEKAVPLPVLIRPWLENVVDTSKAVHHSWTMLKMDSLLDLFKCMATNCSFHTPSLCEFVAHQEYHLIQKIDEENCRKCAYCTFEAEIPMILVQHIKNNHDEQKICCKHCFFRCS